MKTRKERKPKPTKFAIWWKWPLIVLALSFVLSLAFGIVSEVALSEAGLAVSIVVILIFILIAIIADMVGVAATAANFEQDPAETTKPPPNQKSAGATRSSRNTRSSLLCLSQ